MRFPVHIAALAAMAVLSILAAAPGTAEQSPYVITSRQIPPEYKVTAELLEYLKPAKEAASGFEASAAPKWDIARLMTFVSAEGFAASDVNRGGKVVKYSTQQIRNAVAGRKGDAFRMLAHLGYIYAQPYKQYSELRFEPQGDGVVVHVSDWYKLTFALQAGQLKLNRLDYLMREGG